MTAAKDFETIGTRGFYRPVAQVSFETAVDMSAEALRAARSLHLFDFVLNTTGLTGFASPDVFARYLMATKVVESAGISLRVAFVARPELIDPQRIGILMLQNRGMSSEVFTSEPDALRWLDARQAATRTRD